MSSKLAAHPGKSGQLFIGLTLLSFCVTCGDLGGAVESSASALAAGTVVVFEAESLARTASATGSQVTTEAGASNNQYVQLLGTPAAGAWIEFTLTNVAAGTYTVKELHKANYNRGIVQASIDGVNQGSPCDQYNAAAVQQVACSLGSKTLTAGSHKMRFTVTGKDSASAGFMMVIDQISLTATGVAGTGGTTGSGGTVGAGGAGNSGGSAGTQKWVGTWTGAPYADTSNPPPIALANSVVRQVTHASLGGSQVRVQFSNLDGNGPLTINAAHVALCRTTPLVDSTIDTSTDKALLFSGAASVTIAAGKEVWSDAVSFSLPALGNLTVTTAFGSVPSTLTQHSGSRTTSYFQSGSTTVTAASMTSAKTAALWFFISAIDVMSDASARGAIAIGDSITDGRGTDTDGNDRWTDIVASRLQGNSPTANVSMMNVGIGATNLIGTSGTAAQARFNHDVLGQDGVKYVVVFEGVNDIAGGATAAQLESAYTDLITRAHAKGLLIYGGTITPFGGDAAYYTAAHESVRQQANTWIRAAGHFDGFIDFDAAITDGGNPPKIQAAYATWAQMDGLHPGPAGYKAMGNTVDLSLFAR